MNFASWELRNRAHVSASTANDVISFDMAQVKENVLIHLDGFNILW